MTSPQPETHDRPRWAGYDSPNDLSGPRVPLYGSDFTADPHLVYRDLRQRYGSLAPVELAPGVPATLVIGYTTAVRILNDPDHFPADPRVWEQSIPADCPVLPVMQSRPIASRCAGAEFLRYRRSMTASIDGVDLHALHSTVERIAIPLINSFCTTGAGDLLKQYAMPLAFEVVADMLGSTREIGQRAAPALAAMFEGVDAELGNQVFAEAMMELIALKRAAPGDDVTTRLLQHPSRLDEMEILHQVLNFHAAALELQQNLIANTLLLILTSAGIGDGVLSGSLSTRDALDEVLFNDPPLANHLISYPRHPILVDGIWLPAHQPVVISMAACNNDPAIRTDDLVGNRSHLAWGAGPHRCPAQPMAYLIAQDAVDQLLDALPEMQLALPAGEPPWRPGPFHRALTTLPVTFTPCLPFTVP
ncbi:cytochrome P450 [Nocardia sp. GAS34]|uniref:cytochrome P450 n=1 Tax=unclassified Nocardia TaxID=2637762 RepID=UPI003D20716F